jgi:PadR family transcriptional regulator AphA
MAPAGRPLSEWVCLALVAEGPTHGWSVARTLAAGGDVGRVWTLSRPLTYRALAQLVGAGLVAASGTSPGRGPARTMLTATPAGRRALRRWLRTPVAHVRDVRTELLLKLALSERAGVDPLPLLRAQRDALAPAFAALARQARSRRADRVDRWRHASSQAVRRFVDAEITRAERRTRRR